MMPDSFSVLIAEDDFTGAAGMASIIKEIAENEQKKIQIDKVSNGQKAISFLAHNSVDLLITDIGMTPVNGLELAKYVVKNHPEIKIIVITGMLTLEYINPLMELKVQGIVYKIEGHPEEFKAALNNAWSTKTFHSRSILEFQRNINGIKANNPNQLTDKERGILRLLAQGSDIKNMADELGISTRTTDRLKSELREKFNAKTDAQLIAEVIRLGII